MLTRVLTQVYTRVPTKIVFLCVIIPYKGSHLSAHVSAHAGAHASVHEVVWSYVIWSVLTCSAPYPSLYVFKLNWGRLLNSCQDPGHSARLVPSQSHRADEVGARFPQFFGEWSSRRGKGYQKWVLQKLLKNTRGSKRLGALFWYPLLAIVRELQNYELADMLKCPKSPNCQN